MAQYITLLKSDSRNSDVDSPVQSNWEKNYALHVVVNISSGSPNLVVAIKGRDELSDVDYTLLTSSIINSGTTVLKLGPDYTAAANVAKDYLPANWLVSVTQSGAVSATYSIGASVI